MLATVLRALRRSAFFLDVVGSPIERCFVATADLKHVVILMKKKMSPTTVSAKEPEKNTVIFKLLTGPGIVPNGDKAVYLFNLDEMSTLNFANRGRYSCHRHNLLTLKHTRRNN